MPELTQIWLVIKLFSNKKKMVRVFVGINVVHVYVLLKMKFILFQLQMQEQR